MPGRPQPSPKHPPLRSVCTGLPPRRLPSLPEHPASGIRWTGDSYGHEWPRAARRGATSGSPRPSSSAGHPCHVPPPKETSSSPHHSSSAGASWPKLHGREPGRRHVRSLPQRSPGLKSNRVPYPSAGRFHLTSPVRAGCPRAHDYSMSRTPGLSRGLLMCGGMAQAAKSGPCSAVTQLWHSSLVSPSALLTSDLVRRSQSSAVSGNKRRTAESQISVRRTRPRVSSTAASVPLPHSRHTSAAAPLAAVGVTPP